MSIRPANDCGEREGEVNAQKFDPCAAHSLSIFLAGKPGRRRPGLVEVIGERVQRLRLRVAVGLLVELRNNVQERHGRPTG